MGRRYPCPLLLHDLLTDVDEQAQCEVGIIVIPSFVGSISALAETRRRAILVLPSESDRDLAFAEENEDLFCDILLPTYGEGEPEWKLSYAWWFACHISDFAVVVHDDAPKRERSRFGNLARLAGNSVWGLNTADQSYTIWSLPNTRRAASWLL